jgi:hypothetical protein
MYNAPAVSYPVGRSHFQTGLTLAVVLAGTVAQGAWWLLSVEHGAGHLLGLLLWLLVAAWALGSVWHTSRSQLVWDGRGWHWTAGTSAQLERPQVILDAQHSLLLCFRQPGGAALWLWPSQRSQPERWLALRRALFNPASPEA